MTGIDVKKEEPLPGQETVSDSSITGRKYTASEQKKIASLKAKLKKEARLPGHVFAGEWRQAIGPAYPLLGVIACSCDWKTGLWRGQIWLLSEVIGKSERTISNWIRRLKKISGLEVTYYSYSIAIQLPESLIPSKGGRVKTGKNFHEIGKNRGYGQKDFSQDTKDWRSEFKKRFGSSGLSKPRTKDGPQHIADLV